MREAGRQVSATRVALLELKDERRLVEEGYELLDEKRMLIAAEIRRQLDEHRRLEETVRARVEAIRDAYAAALRRHGLDELECVPTLACTGADLALQHRPFLGIDLVTAKLDTGECEPRAPAAIPSREAGDAATAHVDALASLAALAANEVSLRRLIEEYVRTERRARALENVLLPEIRATLRFVEDQLENLEQEEAIRTRYRAGPRARPGSTGQADRARSA